MNRTAPKPPPGKGRLPKGARGGIATSEVLYSEAEAEVLRAVDAYKRRTGRKFPLVTEILGVILGLGYRKDGA